MCFVSAFILVNLSLRSSRCFVPFLSPIGAAQRGMGCPRNQRGLRRAVGEVAVGVVWNQLPSGYLGVVE